MQRYGVSVSTEDIEGAMAAKEEAVVHILQTLFDYIHHPDAVIEDGASTSGQREVRLAAVRLLGSAPDS